MSKVFCRSPSCGSVQHGRVFGTGNLTACMNVTAEHEVEESIGDNLLVVEERFEKCSLVNIYSVDSWDFVVQEKPCVSDGNLSYSPFVGQDLA